MIFQLTGRDYATIILNGGAIILIFGVLRTFLFTNVKDRLDDVLFIRLMILNILLALANTVSYVIDYKEINGAWLIKMISTTLFYLVLMLTGLCWRHYTSVRFAYDLRKNWRRNLIITVAALLSLIILINPFTGWFFSLDSDMDLHRGLLYVPVYIIIVIYVFAGFFDIVRYRTNRGTKGPVPVWFYMLPVICGGLLTLFVPGSPSFAPIGIAISIAFTHAGTVTEVTDILS